MLQERFAKVKRANINDSEKKKKRNKMPQRKISILVMNSVLSLFKAVVPLAGSASGCSIGVGVV